MTKAIVLRAHGGVDQLVLDSVTLPPPAPGELRVRQTAMGVNFHDIYVRTGLYKTLNLPGIPGIDGIGVVDEIGQGVAGFKKGDRIGYVTMQYGAYATHRNLPAALAIPLPDRMEDRLAATVLLKALTVEMLINRVHHLQAGQTLLVQAAAGGVGRLLVQWAKARGAIVYGTAGSAEKIKIAYAAGCDAVIAYRDVNFVDAIMDLTKGQGVDVAYDAVGRDTFDGSLQCLARFGRLINFGQSSGPVPPFEVSRLARGSHTVARPIIFHYLDAPALRTEMARNVFEAFERGWMQASVGTAFALEDVGAAHAALEARSDQGPFILIP